jgi:hypothetical protein
LLRDADRYALMRLRLHFECPRYCFQPEPFQFSRSRQHYFTPRRYELLLMARLPLRRPSEFFFIRHAEIRRWRLRLRRSRTMPKIRRLSSPDVEITPLISMLLIFSRLRWYFAATTGCRYAAMILFLYAAPWAYADCSILFAMPPRLHFLRAADMNISRATPEIDVWSPSFLRHY